MSATCRIIPVVALASALLSCSSTDGSGSQVPCLSIRLAEGGFSAVAPSKLSLFFTVDTCATQNTAAKPVAGLSKDHFQVQEDGASVSPFESQQSIQPKGQKFRLYTLLLLDLSGSILRSGNFPALRESALLFVDRVLGSGREGHQLAIATFDGRDTLSVISGYTENKAAAQDAIRGLDVVECQSSANCSAFPDHRTCAGHRCVDDSTNLNGAVIRGLEHLDQQRKAEPSIAYRETSLVLFTDGTDQAARASQREALDKVSASNSYVMGIGMGGEVDTSALRQLSKDGYFPAGSPEDLGGAFDELATKVVALANRFYLLEYCSPKRGGTHRLRLLATTTFDLYGPLSGAMEQSFDATGFTSGCEIPQPH
jgi:hypothetical protein